VNLYNRKEIAVLFYVAGLLSGMVVAFAACTRDAAPVEHVTVVGR
jgi:hypothetical protein